MRDAISSLLPSGVQRQHNRILRLAFPHDDGPGAALLVNAIEASEGLSRPFVYTLELLSDDAHIELKALQGKLLCVELVRADGTLRHFSGHVFRFGLTRVDGGLAYYRAVLGPWLDYLGLRKDNYLFHHATLYDQTRSIMADYGALADWDWRVAGADRPMTDACQFDESDLNYLARRWAAAGLYYWFEHSARGHRLVLADDSISAAPIDGGADVPYQRHGGAIEEDGIGDWSPSRDLVHASVAVASYDFKSGRPLHTSTTTVNRQGEVPVIESYEYTGAHGFGDLAGGDALARLRMEETEARAKAFEGGGNNRHLMPGRWFRLTGHFDRGADAEFLVVECTHRATNNYGVGEELPSYGNRFTCLRRKIPWRPGRGFHCQQTRIYGIQSATVVGPRGEEIHTDAFGRVRVQFHWDREGAGDERSSAWIRVATPWAGANFGMTAIPRIGAEVLVAFMDGNPDRPVITGMVPNANTMPPWTLPANKTQSGMLSRSSPGGGYDNANAIRFEDKRGAEQLWAQAERNLDTVVKGSETRSVGGARTVSVGAANAESIGGDATCDVGGACSTTVKRDMTVNVTEGRQESTVKGDIMVTSLSGEVMVTSPRKLTLSVGGSSITMTPDEITIVAGKIFLNP
ncbi:type VI secretion system Vgr family protein [Massilia sp. YIM B02443]|uniref:type VI secretion system Vgr family protein n=1 Tax=Massilia sp. YIM B02443 TaxID=3050127 RepID=UPI0025B6984B|nr:type VI secretion system tip protein TssI/VgrG [Massilia sp. YIM B02443]MDN4038150.1 type VI secretion system tip protein TssI/VgrG [Massilia sp. YIM B02443]